MQNQLQADAFFSKKLTNFRGQVKDAFMKTDPEIWTSLKAGQQSALESIYNTHIDYLLQYGTRFTKDELLVEDCVHDLFIDLWKNRNGLGMTNSIRAYLLVALRRSIIKKVQKKLKHESGKTPDEYDFKAEIAIDEMIIAAELSKEQLQQLQNAMDNLSKRQREVLYLKYYQEIPYDEICEIMEISYQSVRNLVANSIRTLRSLMELLVLVFIFLG